MNATHSTYASAKYANRVGVVENGLLTVIDHGAIVAEHLVEGFEPAEIWGLINTPSISAKLPVKAQVITSYGDMQHHRKGCELCRYNRFCAEGDRLRDAMYADLNARRTPYVIETTDQTVDGPRVIRKGTWHKDAAEAAVRMSGGRSVLIDQSETYIVVL